MEALKLTLVGDVDVGKDCLLRTYTTRIFPKPNARSSREKFVHNTKVMVNGKYIALELRCIVGQDEYDRLRPLYVGSDVMLICYSASSRSSLEAVKSKWFTEVESHCFTTPKILVACKIDLRVEDDSSFVQYEEGEALARQFGMRYCETSSLTKKGLNQCFDDAIWFGLHGLARDNKRKKKFYPYTGEPNQTPPIMPPGICPTIELEQSDFVQHWLEMARNPKHADVTFVVNGVPIVANRVILCSSSNFFADLFGVTEEAKLNKLIQSCSEDGITIDEEETEKDITVISRICETTNELSGQNHTTVYLSKDTKLTPFHHILEFLYTGKLDFTEEDVLKVVDDLLYLAHAFKLSHLETILLHKGYTNSEASELAHDEAKTRMKELFFNNSDVADIVFNVDGERIYAIKLVLATRCEEIRIMFENNPVDGDPRIQEISIPDVSAGCFLAFLEYIYTDKYPEAWGDPMELLVVANKYSQKRLVNLCELNVQKDIEESLSQNGDDSLEACVIDMLLMSQMHNAEQLAQWCLHFISSNYDAFANRDDFSKLDGSNREYIDENRWPSLAYFFRVHGYRKLMEKKSCVVI
ncbi:hypothetical protein ScPMuIL_012379 [Solemya velum]